MEHYIVSARKYRPMDFHSVVGQQALTATLKNAITTNHLAHAYLFCGPRGVGKTTCARIFAKTINCSERTPEGEACNTCPSCCGFNEQRSFNIHELDAASNNSVDDIRSLVEQVRIPPQIGKYSVYIIDEVHMLSAAAFNAFLKTLEEPPAHAIFVLATTEKHKIIPTILSRCQIYDFNRIKVTDMVTYLQYIASQEHIDAPAEALNVIAQKADGAMRDALSIFDQMVSFCGNRITYQAVIENLNVLDYDYYFKMVDAFLQNNVTAALLLFNDIINSGFEAQHFVSGLASHMRDLLVSRDAVTLPLLEVGAAIVEQYSAQAQHCPVPFIYRALAIANQCDLAYRTAKNKRLLVELMLIELCQITGTELHKPDDSKRIAPVNNQLDGTLSTDKSGVPPPAPQATVKPQVDNGTPPQAVPLVAPPRGVSIQITPTASVSEKQAAVPVPATDTPAAPKREQPFDQSQLLGAWQAYADQIKEQPHLYNTLCNFPPQLVANNVCQVKLANHNQMNEFMPRRQSIEQWLADTLENDAVTLEIILDTSLGKEMAFAPEEKLALMMKKNPGLKRFNDTFGLELEF
ncbi:MAG: DNA polymerase III subunit gamma/tau [Prevotellaceae bacterium]|nr:DNA polymerase III subunit gamma/tau [Prevotellaceae bacterium]